MLSPLTLTRHGVASYLYPPTLRLFFFRFCLLLLRTSAQLFAQAPDIPSPLAFLPGHEFLNPPPHSPLSLPIALKPLLPSNLPDSLYYSSCVFLKRKKRKKKTSRPSAPTTLYSPPPPLVTAAIVPFVDPPLPLYQKGGPRPSLLFLWTRDEGRRALAGPDSLLWIKSVASQTDEWDPSEVVLSFLHGWWWALGRFRRSSPHFPVLFFSPRPPSTPSYSSTKILFFVCGLTHF